MAFWDDVEDFVSDVVDGAEDLVDDAGESIEEAGAAVLDELGLSPEDIAEEIGRLITGESGPDKTRTDVDAERAEALRLAQLDPRVEFEPGAVQTTPDGFLGDGIYSKMPTDADASYEHSDGGLSEQILTTPADASFSLMGY